MPRGEEVLKVEHGQEVAHGLGQKKSGKQKAARLLAPAPPGSESRTLLFMEVSMATVRQAAVLNLGRKSSQIVSKYRNTPHAISRRLRQIASGYIRSFP